MSDKKKTTADEEIKDFPQQNTFNTDDMSVTHDDEKEAK